MATFATIRDNAKNEVRYDLTSTELADASYWNRWINEVYDHILDDLQNYNPNWFITKYGTPYTFDGSTQFQDLPADYAKFVKLVDNSAVVGDDYPDVPKGDLATGKPGYVLTYKQTNATTNSNQIGIVGITDYPKQYTLWYQMRPAQLSGDTDVPAFNSRYHDVLEFGAEWRYWVYREDDKQALYKSLYEERRAELLETIPDDNSFNGSKNVQILTDGWD